MPVYSDMNGFPEAGFPLLTDESDRLVLNTLYTVPQKYLNCIIDVNGNNRLIGALVLGGAVTGATSITMAGALAGATTVGASDTVTLTSATAPLIMSGVNAALIMSGAMASIGTYLQRINKGYFKDLDIANRPTVGQDYVALISDLVPLAKDSYTNLTPMPEKVGGAEVGTTFNAVTISNVLTTILYPYQIPSFLTFTLTGFVAILECGVNFVGGVQTFAWTFLNGTNVKPGSIAIRDVSNNIDLVSGLDDDGSEAITLTADTRTVTNQTRVWSIRAINTKSQDINYPSYTTRLTTTFYSPFFYGVGSAGLTVAQIQELTKSVTAKGTKTFSFSPTNQVFYFAYPASHGNLTSIKDPNNFEILSDFTKRTENFTNNPGFYEGITTSYYIYEFNNLTTQVGFNITFTF